MAKRKSHIAQGNVAPSPLSEVHRRSDLPGKGKVPKRAADLAFNKYLYLRAKGTKAPRVEAHSIGAEKNVSAWRIPLSADIVEGLPGRRMEAITPDDPKAEMSDAPLSLDSHRPNWVSLAFSPRLAAPHQARFLRRRNGNRVVPDFIFGSDNRSVIQPLSYPWFCVGRLRVEVQGAFAWGGAGALVGENIVLTASHLIPWFAAASGFSWRITFTPGSYDDVSVVGEGYQSDVDEVRGYPGFCQGDDMAILKLYEPLGYGLGYFGYATYNDAWEDEPYWTLVGYPSAIAGGDRPTSQSNIAVLDDDSDGEGTELEHNGDATAGNSGGPLFGWWDNSPRVIGTHSGGEINFLEGTNNVAAGGRALSRLISWGRRHW